MRCSEGIDFFLIVFQIPGIEVDNHSGSVTALDFCTTNMGLAVGNERGLVRTVLCITFFFLLEL